MDILELPKPVVALVAIARNSNHLIFYVKECKLSFYHAVISIVVKVIECNCISELNQLIEFSFSQGMILYTYRMSYYLLFSSEICCTYVELSFVVVVVIMIIIVIASNDTTCI